jgi:hypothetical protein
MESIVKRELAPVLEPLPSADDPLFRCAEESADGSAHETAGEQQAGRPDLLRRFTSTPHAMDLQLMRRTVRLETNQAAVLELARTFFERHQHGSVAPPEFRWRIVCESDPHVPSTDVPFSAFSDPGLRYVNIGQRGFMAVDLDHREAVAFLSDSFVDGDTRFRHRSPLDILFCMTAASLGLTALSGGCVGVEDRAVLVFGPPNSGKTTASYLAAKLGLEFHADQVVFLDASEGNVCAWGDPFPAVFRPETVEFLPELRLSARHSFYNDLSFYYYDKGPMQPMHARRVAPACSLFLDRGAAPDKELRRLTAEDAVSRLHDCMLFDEDPRFDGQIETALTLLSEKPVYALRYGSDPKIAAQAIAEMLR